MDTRPEEILAILDQCCDDFTFPMLDNGYVYPAATRLGLFRGNVDWAMVIEVFGYSPRTGIPDTSIQTYASRLHSRDTCDSYVTKDAWLSYLENNPNNEFRSIFPFDNDVWIEDELVAEDGSEITVRGTSVALPPRDIYSNHGVALESPTTVEVFEFCRYLAAVKRDLVLATEVERRVSVPPDLELILSLDDWHHPDVVDDECRPSGSETFQQLARVLVTGDTSQYRPSKEPNTHWSNWPEGGTL